MRGKTGTQTGGSTAHAHTHNGCVAGRHMIQMVAREDVLSLLYPVSAGLHCVGLGSPVQHLEGGHGIVWRSQTRAQRARVWSQAYIAICTKLQRYCSPIRLQNAQLPNSDIRYIL